MSRPGTPGPTDPSTGLDAVQVDENRVRFGSNRLPEPEHRRLHAIVADVVREPMLLLLLLASGLYLVLGDAREAALLGASVLLVVALAVFQEQRSERALQALRELGAPQARVLRAGQPGRIAAQDVVVGDIVLLAEGDRVPADARLIEQDDLHLDESLLTGESVPVARVVAEGDEGRVHAGSLVVRGRARAEVDAVGERTGVGRVGAALHAIHPGRTPLQAAMRRLVAGFAVAALAVSALVAGLHWWQRGDAPGSMLAGITLAMATIPEEFPVVLAVFLALGGWRMARHRVLVRRAAAIETLGAVSVLCVDQTGTLTENRMAVARLIADADAETETETDAAREQDRLLDFAVLASRPDSLDPMERALREACGARVASLPTLEGHRREYPLRPQRPALAHAWDTADGILVGCKGAPETVAELCGLDAPSRQRVATALDELAAEGLRVLGVARAGPFPAGTLPADMADLHLRWLGLVAFADPLRAAAPAAVAEAQAAGIHVLMLTGDHAVTAAAIARQAGIAVGTGVVAGAQLDALDEPAVDAILRQARVFARVRPEQKLRLVQALRRAGEVVGMTGDGVNDAPALVAADVGVAMGGRGTDVAREAAAIVLLDDDFSSLVRAVRMGRAIHDNIRRAMRYILSVHVPIVGLALLPLLSGSPLVLMPLHVVFLELIIDPACSILFERQPPARDLMTRPPRPRDEPLLPVGDLVGSLFQGVLVLAMVVAVHAWARWTLELPHAQAAALAFASMVAGNLGLILRHGSGESAFDRLRAAGGLHVAIAGSALVLLAMATLVPGAAAWFAFDPPPLGPWALAVLAPLALGPVLPWLPGFRAR